MTIDAWLLERLVCPATRTPLRYDADRQELVSEAAGIAYPVRDGVPVLLVEAGRRLDSSSFRT
ncbi:MAG: Trm112 family protein [Sphingomonas phyllosphaerae]